MLSAPKYYNADKWVCLRELNTTGTRDKCILINPQNNLSYYFKTSINKGRKNYPCEFWSEIIASALGEQLKLPVLKYELASYKGKIGCISQNIINPLKEEFIEGVNLIIQIDPNFRDCCKNGHHIDKIKSALSNIGLIEYKRVVIEMILFDCIIGNTDRHSENWALIRNKNGELIYSELKQRPFISRWLTYWKFHKLTGLPLFQIRKTVAVLRHQFAPFYDNGSSLGRELSEQRIEELMSSADEFERFFIGGKSDIIVGNGKMSFLDTIDFLMSDYPMECGHFVNKHLSLYNKEQFHSLINNIDNNYPVLEFNENRISTCRKNFIFQLIDERINYIFNKAKQYGKQI